MAKTLKTKALEALLDSRTLSEAAQKAGIARKTLYDYMRNDSEFAKAFQAAQERLILERIETIDHDQKRAMQTVFAIMDDQNQPGAVRLRAAQTILETSEALRKCAAEIAAANAAATATKDENEMPTIVIRMDKERADQMN